MSKSTSLRAAAQTTPATEKTRNRRTVTGARQLGALLPPPKPRTISAVQLMEALERPIAFHPILARISGGVAAGIMLSQALYWSKIQEKWNQGADGWFYKTEADWELETTLTEEEQLTAKCCLLERDLMFIEKRGCPAKNHYKVNKERLAEALSVHLDITQCAAKPRTSGRQNRPPVRGNPAQHKEHKTPQPTTHKNGGPPQPTEAQLKAFYDSLTGEEISELAEWLDEEMKPFARLKTDTEQQRAQTWLSILRSEYHRRMNGNLSLDFTTQEDGNQ